MPNLTKIVGNAVRDVVIDTHTHVISGDLARYPLSAAPGIAHDWVQESPVSAPTLLAEMDLAGVSGAVLVQARGAYGFDNSYIADALPLDPGRFVNAAVIDMAADDRTERLRFWSRTRGILGLRLFNIPPADPGWINDASTADFVREAAGSGVRISICALSPDLMAIGAMLGRAPHVPIAIDHCGFVDLSAGVRSAGAQALVALAAHDNVRLKVTTTVLEIGADGGLDSRDVVEWLCGAFGAHRLMWGSDFPQYHRETYSEIVASGRHACSRLSPGEQARFLGGTALELWPELRPAG